MHRVSDILISAGIVRDHQEVTAIDIPFIFKSVGITDATIYYYGVKHVAISRAATQEMAEKMTIYADNLRLLKICLRKSGVIFRASGSLVPRNDLVCQHCGYQNQFLREKGVDVSLATDLAIDAALEKSKDIYLASSDTDLIPALLGAKKCGARHLYNANYICDHSLTYL